MGKSKKGASSKAASMAPPTSPFVEVTKSLYLTLSPCAYNFPVEGLCAEHISPNIMSYYPPLHGVLLSYSNPRMSEVEPDTQAPTPTQTVTPPPEHVLAQSIGEYAVSYVWLTCDFLVFRPERGTILEGKVHLQSESIVGFLCYNYFNAAIESVKLPGDWKWDGEQWVDSEEKAVLGKTIEFKVEDFEATSQETITIVGTLA